MRKSAVKNSTGDQPRINAPSTFVRYIAENRLLTFGKRRCVMNRMRLVIVPVLVLMSAFTVLGKSKEEKQAEARKKADATLQRLYKAKPSAQAAIKSAAGYAVFNSGGAKILVAGAGRGRGIAVDKSTKKVTYMKMREIQAGLGMGDLLRRFVDGNATSLAGARDEN